MYRQFFNLEKKPFQITSDNTFLWLGKKHATVLNMLQRGIVESCGLMVLTGDIGTGKTTLINELHTMDGKVQMVRIPDPYFEIHHLYQIIAESLGFENKVRGKKFSSVFLAVLKEAHRKGNKILFIVDEAQRIPERFLKQIISWSNMDVNPVLTILLVGQPELEEILKDNLGKAWQDEFDVFTRLEPLDEKETGLYISKRLEISGAAHEIFSKSSKHEAYCYSQGIPRLINISCDQAMLAAYSESKQQIDAQIFRSILPKLDLPVFKGRNKDDVHNYTFFRSKIFMLSAVAAFICLFLVYSFFPEYFTPAARTASPRINEVKFKISDSTVNREPHVLSGVKMKPVIQESFEAIYKSTGDKKTGLGYTPADAENIKNIDAFIEDVFMTEKTIPGTKEAYLPEPLNEPDPNAVIDWLVNEKKSKGNGSP